MNKVIILIEKYKNDLPNEYHYIINDLKTYLEQQKKKNNEYKKNYYHNNKDKLRSYHKKYESEKYTKIKKIKSSELNDIINNNNNFIETQTQTLTETNTQ